MSAPTVKSDIIQGCNIEAPSRVGLYQEHARSCPPASLWRSPFIQNGNRKLLELWAYNCVPWMPWVLLGLQIHLEQKRNRHYQCSRSQMVFKQNTYILFLYKPNQKKNALLNKLKLQQIGFKNQGSGRVDGCWVTCVSDSQTWLARPFTWDCIHLPFRNSDVLGVGQHTEIVI